MIRPKGPVKITMQQEGEQGGLTATGVWRYALYILLGLGLFVVTSGLAALLDWLK